MNGLKACPVCGAKAYLHHDFVDGFDMGYSVGCPRYCLYDGIHGHTKETPEEERLAEYYFSSAEKAAEWWNRRASRDTSRND